jgi:hypothetical protein
MVFVHAVSQAIVVAEIFMVSKGGSVTVKFAEAVQPFASVTVTVYVPAQRPVCIGAFGPPLLQV